MRIPVCEVDALVLPSAPRSIQFLNDIPAVALGPRGFLSRHCQVPHGASISFSSPWLMNPICGLCVIISHKAGEGPNLLAESRFTERVGGGGGSVSETGTVTANYARRDARQHTRQLKCQCVHQKHRLPAQSSAARRMQAHSPDSFTE